MELHHISGNVYFLDNVTNIGVIKFGCNAILIDSGLDDDCGKKILKCLDKNGLTPYAIINTHSHADHCGGNAYIKAKTGAIIYAPEIEKEVIEHPFLEPTYLFSGATPVKELTNKYLMAKPSVVDDVIEAHENILEIDHLRLKVVHLPGHSFNQIGIEYNDVLFCADSVFAKETLLKHKTPFCIDVDRQKTTLDQLKKAEYRYYVPSHGEPCGDISDLANAYLDIIDYTERLIMDMLATPKTTQDVLKGLCDSNNFEMSNVQQHYLNMTLIMAYLSSLHNRDRLIIRMHENMLYWEKV